MASADPLAEHASLLAAAKFIARDQGNVHSLESGSGAAGDAFDSALVHISNAINVQLREGREADAQELFDRYGSQGHHPCAVLGYEQNVALEDATTILIYWIPRLLALKRANV
jgi:hypothetical protein